MAYQANIRFDQEIAFELIPFNIRFKKPAKTSRDTLTSRDIYFVKLFYTQKPDVYGLGECSPIYGLSPESPQEVKESLEHHLNAIATHRSVDFTTIEISSVRFCLEMAVMDLINGGARRIFPGRFESPIPINGLVWMNSVDVMKNEGLEKIFAGFSTIKFKVGAENFEEEMEMLSYVRSHYSSDRITIRLDANGAFETSSALHKLELLSRFEIHSIEQPIRAGQWKEMRALIEKSTIPIALDEELIGVSKFEQKLLLLKSIQPAYIVLKPMLHGGIGGCNEWMRAAQTLGIRYWVTSMLESSVGLNAIAQWVSNMNVEMPQGLGTGGLYENNLTAAWETNNGELRFLGQEALDKIQLS